MNYYCLTCKNPQKEYDVYFCIKCINTSKELYELYREEKHLYQSNIENIKFLTYNEEKIQLTIELLQKLQNILPTIIKSMQKKRKLKGFL